MQFITLKRLNRVGHLRVQKARDATADKKGKVDNYHLKLQNLLYEVIHLQKEINKCLEFKSADEEINLVPVEEFQVGIFNVFGLGCCFLSVILILIPNCFFDFQRDAPEDLTSTSSQNPHEERKVN